MQREFSRVSELDDLGDKNAPEGSRPWCRYHSRLARKARNEYAADVKFLRIDLQRLKTAEAWKALGYLSWGLLCEEEILLSEEEAEWILQAKDGQTLGVVLGSWGGDRRSKEAKANQGNNITLKQRGTRAEYLLARLERQFPEIFADYEAGKFPSVRQAALAAGIVKKPDPVAQAARLWDKMTELQREMFLRRIGARMVSDE